jgi:hypothetical protein
MIKLLKKIIPIPAQNYRSNKNGSAITCTYIQHTLQTFWRSFSNWMALLKSNTAAQTLEVSQNSLGWRSFWTLKSICNFINITLTFVQHDDFIPWIPVGHPTNMSPYLLATATKFTAPVNVPSCAVKILSRLWSLNWKSWKIQMNRYVNMYFTHRNVDTNTNESIARTDYSFQSFRSSVVCECTAKGIGMKLHTQSTLSCFGILNWTIYENKYCHRNFQTHFQPSSSENENPHLHPSPWPPYTQSAI